MVTEGDEDEEDVWDLDAENGFLSHSKMLYVVNQRQVRHTTMIEDEV